MAAIPAPRPARSCPFIVRHFGITRLLEMMDHAQMDGARHPGRGKRNCLSGNPGHSIILKWHREAENQNAMNEEKIDTHHKALQINLDAKKYGTIAEIGAGQEVARWFFHVGGAAGTVAKTISAYDRGVSDAISGRSDRCSSRARL